MRSKVCLLLALTVVPGCFGSFKLTNTVWEFNRDVSDSIIVQEIVFLAFVIVPVYGLSTFADALVLNTIEAITGNNPIGAADRPDAIDGRAARRIVRAARKVELVEGERVVRSAELQEDGSLLLVDEAGNASVVDAARVEAAANAWRTGGADCLASEVEAALAQ